MKRAHSPIDISASISEKVDAAFAWVDGQSAATSHGRSREPNGGSKATIRDVATAAGVSRGTVSRYFNHPHLVSKDAFDLIERAIEDLGFVRNAEAQRLGLKRGRRDTDQAGLELSSG
ncbi:LacI family DNA-binding transcriptional regulator [Microbacterium sp. SS28]|uniref:LacI family DNA-binding transcriptional regulator n=1 Tax=Microbacterium sp. SS28 TaxID=2919948 RepID=UPI001FAA76A5|nr:LacI family DNA-binding transcriptional regulator [Microbacterium sp. SS28]